jgi:hypothetical protein
VDAFVSDPRTTASGIDEPEEPEGIQGTPRNSEEPRGTRGTPRNSEDTVELRGTRKNYFFELTLYPGGTVKRSSESDPVSTESVTVVIEMLPILDITAAIGPSPLIFMFISV